MANRFLNNITINDAYTFPSTDGSDGQAIITDGAGNLSFGSVAAASADSAESTHLNVKNTSGSLIAKGTPVYITGNVGNTDKLEIAPADASSASTMPAVGLLETDLANNGEGFVVQGGFLKDLVTATIDGTSTSSNDTVYVKSGGGLTMTKPTGASNFIQNIAKVARVHASNGSLVVSSILRANDVPNLSTGKIWVGTSANTAESTLVDIDETNNILTVDGKVYYSNVFSTLSDLPSATTYHGMFAHVHSEGAAYYAHAGAWVKLANYSDLSGAANDATITLTAGTGLSGGGDFTTDQSTNETITVDLDDTAVTPGTYGDANNTPQITIDQQGRITSATTVETAGSGSGGSGSGVELSIERDVFTATANQTAFTISSAITASSNTQVYIDGVYQAKDNYTTSGSTVTFSTGVTLGAEVEVVHFISVLSKVYTDTFTGDGSDTTFDASKDVTDENVTQVYIDGVYQSKDNYTTSGTTITFSTAPPDGSAIEVVHFTAAEYSTLNSNQFTGTGSQTDFTLTQEVDIDKSFVFIQGIYQEKSTYSIDSTTLTFTTAPTDGSTIEVITVGAVSIFNDTLYVDNFDGTGSQVDYTLSTSPASENAIDVYINGLYQQKDTFSLSGSTLTFSTAPPNGSTIEVKSTGGLNNVVSSGASVTLDSTPKTADFTADANKIHLVDTTSTAITVTLPSSPSNGDEIGIIDYSSNAETNNITITSTDDIQNSADDKEINYDNGAVNLIYTGATKGWLVKSAANETAEALAPVSVPIDYLVVAGGGSGSSGYGGSPQAGGGAGGLRTSYGSNSGGGASAESSLKLLLSTDYTVTVGAGGTGPAAGNLTIGTDGSDSVFSTITSTGGGAARSWGSAGGSSNSGGSGGGASYNNMSPGSGTTNQGFAGGSMYGFAAGPGSGGGGAASAGSWNSTDMGVGGDGLEVNITGGTGNYYAGGGGRVWTNIQGGGGVSASSAGNGGNGNANTGGGGGGGNANSGSGGNGGTGVVIIRYPNTYTVTIGSGLTGTTATDGSDKVTTFTAGTGTISIS